METGNGTTSVILNKKQQQLANSYFLHLFQLLNLKVGCITHEKKELGTL